MSDSKNTHAIGWGVGGTVATGVCVVGMVFTGPVGWIVFGTVAGIGSSVAVSSVQQGLDNS